MLRTVAELLLLASSNAHLPNMASPGALLTSHFSRLTSHLLLLISHFFLLPSYRYAYMQSTGPSYFLPLTSYFLLLTGTDDEPHCGLVAFVTACFWLLDVDPKTNKLTISTNLKAEAGPLIVLVKNFMASGRFCPSQNPLITEWQCVRKYDPKLKGPPPAHEKAKPGKKRKRTEKEFSTRRTAFAHEA